MPGIEVRGLGAVEATLEVLPQASKTALQSFVGHAASTVQRLWKTYLSGPATRKTLGVGTGALRASIQIERTGPYSAVIGSDKPYARIHEFGGQTRPHLIRPRTAKALRFLIREGALASAAGRGGVGGPTIRAKLASGKIVRGELRFARVVHHPGSKIPPRPHREPALRASEGILTALANGAADEAMRIADAITAGQKSMLDDLTGRGLTGRRTGPVRYFKR